MKRLNWLLYVAIIAFTAILIGFIGHTTDTPLKPVYAVQKVRMNDTATPKTVDKKTCGCCAQRFDRQQARIKQAQARKFAREQDAKISSP